MIVIDVAAMIPSIEISFPLANISIAAIGILGGIFYSNLSSTGRVEFRENSAWEGGGAIKGQYRDIIVFNRNTYTHFDKNI